MPKLRSEDLRKMAVDIIVFHDVTPCRSVDKHVSQKGAASLFRLRE